MLIKFTKDLGKYRSGELHLCKSLRDKEKAKSLLDWGFAVEVKNSPAEQKKQKGITKKNKERHLQKMALELRRVKEEKEKLMTLVGGGFIALEEELREKDQLISQNSERLKILKEASSKAERLIGFKKKIQQREKKNQEEGDQKNALLKEQLKKIEEESRGLKVEIKKAQNNFAFKEKSFLEKETNQQKELLFLKEALAGRERELEASLAAQALAVSELQNELTVLQKSNKKLALQIRSLEKEKQIIKEESARSLIFFEDQLNEKDKQIGVLSSSLVNKKIKSR